MPSGMTVMLAVEPVDMRRSFDGLAALVAERCTADPRAGRMMFAFVNRPRTALKVLWRDDHGWFILARRLDTKVAVLPRDIPAGARSVVVDMRALAALLAGTEPSPRPTRRQVARAARDAVDDQLRKARNHATPGGG